MFTYDSTTLLKQPMDPSPLKTTLSIDSTQNQPPLKEQVQQNTMRHSPLASSTSDTHALKRRTFTQPYTTAKLTLNSFEVLSMLGEGSYAKVIKVRHKLTGRLYALKVIEKSHIQYD